MKSLLLDNILIKQSSYKIAFFKAMKNHCNEDRH